MGLRYADGTATSFMSSVNESLSAWKLNYELLWEDKDTDTIDWVQAEFDALWNDLRAVDLSVCPFIVQDVQRIISRTVIEPIELTTIADPTLVAAALRLRLKPRCTGVIRACGRTRNTLPGWHWSGTAWVAHAWYWLTEWVWARRCNWRWRPC